MSDHKQASAVAEDYYDSDDAVRFYKDVWGGEDIHVGLYKSEDEPIKDASLRTVETIASMLDLPEGAHVVDLGAGYGGGARWMVRERGWRVTCVNIADVQNQINRQMNARAGLDDRIEVIHGSFNEVPAGDASFDAVWSQDSFLHGADREGIIAECARIVKPGGDIIFTDPMKADGADDAELDAILKRIRLSSLASVAFYRKAAKDAGLEEVDVREHPDQLGRHYGRVREELIKNRAEIEKTVSADYIDNMIEGLGHWVDGAATGKLNWGILHFRKPE